MKKIISAIVGLCMLSAVSADVNSLVKFLNSYTSLSAQFNQVLKLSGDEQGIKASGSLSMQKPNLVYVEANNPFGTGKWQMISNGTQIWTVNRDQISVSPFKSLPSIQDLLFFKGNAQALQAVYKVKTISATRYELFPRDPTAEIKEIIVEFDNKGMLASATAIAKVGTNEIQFNHVELNPTLSPDLFQYVPPPGATVKTVNS